MKSSVQFLLMVVAVATATADVTILQDLEFTGPAGPVVRHVVIKLKGKMLKTDMGDSTTITDVESGKRITLMHPMKLCMVSTEAKEMEMLNRIAKSTATHTAPPTKAVVHATGKKQTISGFPTEEYLWESSSARGSWWVAKEVPDRDEIKAAMEILMRPGQLMGVSPSLTEFDGLPIQTETTQSVPTLGSTPAGPVQTGSQPHTTKSIIREIQSGPVAESEFQIPSGYRMIKQ